MASKRLKISDIISELQEKYSGRRLCISYEDYLRKYCENTEKDIVIIRSILLYHFEPSDKYTPFKPMIKYTDGSRSSIPDDLSKGDLQLLKDNYKLITDNELKARVADVLWIRKQGYEYANDAIKAYLESAKILRNDDWVHSWQNIERAVRLSLLLKNKKLYDELTTYIIELISNTNIESEVYLPLRLMDFMLDMDKDIVNQAIPILEHILSQLKQSDNKILNVNDYLDYLAKCYKITDDKVKSSEKLVEHAENHIQQTTFDIGAMNKVYHIEQAIQLLRDAGNQQTKISELRLMIKDFQSNIYHEMQTFKSDSFDITKIVEHATKSVQDKTKQQALLAFSITNLHFKYDEGMDYVKNQSSKSLMSLLAVRRNLDGKGRTVSIEKSKSNLNDNFSDDDLKSELLQHFSIAIQLNVEANILRMQNQIMMEHEIRIEDIEQILHYNPCIEKNHIRLFAESILFGFQEKWHLVGSLLPIQFEHYLRILLEKLGQDPTSFKSDSTQSEKTINTFFENDDLKNALYGYFGQDIFYMLEALLIQDKNKIGFNLRNQTAHALMGIDQYYSYHVIYFWWFAVHILFNPWQNCMIESENKKSQE